jgi:hypothetical protein
MKYASNNLDNVYKYGFLPNVWEKTSEKDIGRIGFQRALAPG